MQNLVSLLYKSYIHYTITTKFIYNIGQYVSLQLSEISAMPIVRNEIDLTTTTTLSHQVRLNCVLQNHRLRLMMAAWEVIRGVVRVYSGIYVLGHRPVAGRALGGVGGLAAQRLAGAVQYRRVHCIRVRVPPVIKSFQLVTVTLGRRHRIS